MIEVKNVTKRYGDFYAVRNINFTIEDGEIVGFLGKNGAGKTTTMNMLTGFIEASAGKIIINGYDIDKKPQKVKELIGYMPEGVPLYSDLTVKEFIAYMADLKKIKRSDKKEAIQKVIEQTGLEQVQNILTRNLSRGFKQRVSFAGALVGDPKILILDEPTVGLDPKQVIEIRELIKSLRKKHTVILSSHILSEVSQICEKVIIIDKGEIVKIDTPENLENSSTEEREIIITVEDNENKFESLKEEISEIKQICLLSTNEDNTKNYKIDVVEDKDIRKDIFEKCSNKNIIILEMKNQKKTLEEAFVKIVEERPNLTAKEITQIEIDRQIEDLKQQKENNKKEKEEKKAERKAKKETKKEKKESKKEEK